MLGFLADLLVGLIGPGNGRRDSPYRAYRHAWKHAARQGTRDEKVLRDSFVLGHVPGASDPDADPVLAAYLERWRRGIAPRDVPRAER